MCLKAQRFFSRSGLRWPRLPESALVSSRIVNDQTHEKVVAEVVDGGSLGSI